MPGAAQTEYHEFLAYFVYFVTVLEVEVQNKGVSRATLPPKAPGDPSLLLCQRVVAPSIPWLVTATLRTLLHLPWPFPTCAPVSSPLL